MLFRSSREPIQSGFDYMLMDNEGLYVHADSIEFPVYTGPYRITLDADERQALLGVLLQRTLTGLTDLDNLIEQLEGGPTT